MAIFIDETSRVVVQGMTGANVSVGFVPPAHAKVAVIEAVDAGMPLVVIITEGIPVADSAAFLAHALAGGTRLIGPGRPGRWP
jgi:succinyl-CoA synthetase alpha subunit